MTNVRQVKQQFSATRPIDFVSMEEMRSYGNKLYYYSGKQSAEPLVGAFLGDFTSVDAPVELEWMFSPDLASTDDFDIEVQINSTVVQKVCTSPASGGFVATPGNYKILIPPGATVKFHGTSLGVSARDIWIWAVGTVIEEATNNG